MEIVFDPLIIIGSLIMVLLVIRIRLTFKEKNICSAQGFTVNQKETEAIKSILWDTSECLAFVTAGVGPANIGLLACETAEQTIRDMWPTHKEYESRQIFLKQLCLKIHRKVTENQNTQSGGCAIALLYITEKQLYWASSGNISIYLQREQLQRLNQRDLYKNYLREKVLAGQISQKRVLSNILKSELVSYLGFENFKRLESSQQPLPLTRKDKLLLADQGFDELFSQIEIEKILRSSQSTVGKAQKFQEQIKQVAGNQTVKYLIMENFRK